MNIATGFTLRILKLCASLDKNKTEVGLKDKNRKDRQQGQKGNTTGVDFCEHEQYSSRSKYVTCNFQVKPYLL